jgi:hypothetical protein
MAVESEMNDKLVAQIDAAEYVIHVMFHVIQMLQFL